MLQRVSNALSSHSARLRTQTRPWSRPLRRPSRLRARPRQRSSDARALAAADAHSLADEGRRQQSSRCEAWPGAAAVRRSAAGARVRFERTQRERARAVAHSTSNTPRRLCRGERAARLHWSSHAPPARLLCACAGPSPGPGGPGQTQHGAHALARVGRGTPLRHASRAFGSLRGAFARVRPTGHLHTTGISGVRLGRGPRVRLTAPRHPAALRTRTVTPAAPAGVARPAALAVRTLTRPRCARPRPRAPPSQAHGAPSGVGARTRRLCHVLSPITGLSGQRLHFRPPLSPAHSHLLSPRAGLRPP